ncbi:hypothetical protein [Thermococcus sp.]|uniref:hypothetical protein n=1 Tax=Thermococcus sp. TaxID=35749 RepID=UPI0025E42712|nr:hypothetical protein [Thermococcus sp.]
MVLDIALMLLPGIMISFTPATAITGMILAFVQYSALKEKERRHIELASLVGSLIGAGFGTGVYGFDRYINQWHSLWWIPTLWFVGSLGGLILSIRQSKGGLGRGY